MRSDPDVWLADLHVSIISPASCLEGAASHRGGYLEEAASMVDASKSLLPDGLVELNDAIMSRPCVPVPGHDMQGPKSCDILAQNTGREAKDFAQPSNARQHGWQQS